MLKFGIIMIFITAFMNISQKTTDNVNVNDVNSNIISTDDKIDDINNQKKVIEDWRLMLVNYENLIPDDYEVKLANIDNIRQFDSRAIEYLNNMLLDMKKVNVKDGWVQSAYRSVESQKEVFDEQVNEYVSQGKTKAEAEEMTLKIINKPGTSEHNLGLAVDFNYVNYDFEKTKAFNWLKENAENYGFILRYPKAKEDITKVDYEPWHWRYVGIENAKDINAKDMCLEEYIEYLQNN